MGSQMRKKNLTEIAYDTLKQQILENYIRPGTMLSEKSVAQDLNMSRTPVREALKMLKSEDFLDIKDGVGTYVKTISRKDIEDAYEVRKSLEILAAKTSIYNISETEVDELENRFLEIKEKYQQGFSLSVEEYAETDWMLHDLIVKKSANKYVERVTGEISAILRRYQFMSVKSFSNAENSINEHLEIVSCIRSKDLQGLTDILSQHIEF